VSFTNLAILILLWLAVAMPAVAVLAKRKLDGPYWGMAVGGLAVLFMPPLGLIYILVLTLLPDRK
jgi:hypothetical protein